MLKLKLFPLFVTSISLLLFNGACKSKDSAEGSYQSANVYTKAIFGKIARESAAYEGPARNPVIFIHGFLGSCLRDRKTGNKVWGIFTGRQMIEGFTKQYFRELAFAMEKNVALNALPKRLEATRLLEEMKVRILNINFHITSYKTIINLLKLGGYVPESQPLAKDKKFYSLFTFHYDWRDDIASNSKRLHEFILVRKKYLQRKYKQLYGLNNFDVQFDLVGHSMGGLVTRYYLRYGAQAIPTIGKGMPKLDWRGAKHVDKAIIIGTPNAGYLDTCLELNKGLRMDSRLPIFPPGLVGTFPSYYQMMPVSGMRAVIENDKAGKPEIDMFDPDVWIKNNWGLADPKEDKILRVLLPKVKSWQERRKIALDHLRKCLFKAKKFTKAMGIKSNPPEDIMLVLFAGDSVMTSRCASPDPKTRKLKVIKWETGDGKVLATSARYDERVGRKFTPFMISPIKWQTVIYVTGAHMGIMNTEAFKANFAYYLLAFPSAKRRTAELYLSKHEEKPKK